MAWRTDLVARGERPLLSSLSSCFMWWFRHIQLQLGLPFQWKGEVGQPLTWWVTQYSSTRCQRGHVPPTRAHRQIMQLQGLPIPLACDFAVPDLRPLQGWKRCPISADCPAQWSDWPNQAALSIFARQGIPQSSSSSSFWNHAALPSSPSAWTSGMVDC